MECSWNTPKQYFIIMSKNGTCIRKVIVLEEGLKLCKKKQADSNFYHFIVITILGGLSMCSGEIRHIWVVYPCLRHHFQRWNKKIKLYIQIYHSGALRRRNYGMWCGVCSCHWQTGTIVKANYSEVVLKYITKMSSEPKQVVRWKQKEAIFH